VFNRVTMPTDLTVILHDKPGELARVGEVAGSAGVHIRGLAAFSGDGHGVAHVLVDDADVEAAVAALKAEHMKVADRREALLVQVAQDAGSLGELARELAESSVNVELAYSAFDGAMALITDDLRSAREALA
jgi:hypothetical protein